MSRVIGWFLVAISTASGQQYPVLPVAGSPHGIYTMLQDSKSRLWLGTIDDVFCFDGVRFFSLRKYAFPRETADALAEDREGGIWIGTQGTAASGGTSHGGLYRYADGHVERVFSGDVLSVASVLPKSVLASFGTEAQRKASYGDLYRFERRGEHWTPESLIRKSVNHMTVDKNGTVLFPCPAGWCELTPERLAKRRTPDAPLPFEEHAGSPLIERVLRDRFGCLWFRAEEFASYQCPGMKEPATVPSNISEDDLSAHLEESPDGSIFMLVSLALGRPGAFHVAQRKNGVPSSLDAAIIARDSTIWLGTETGLYRFMYPFHLEYWSGDKGTQGTNSIVRLHDQIFATGRPGLWTLSQDRDRWRPLAGTERLGNLIAATGAEETILAASSNTVAQIRTDGKLIAKSVLPYQGVFLSLAMTPDGQKLLGGIGLNRMIVSGSKIALSRENVPAQGVSNLQYDQDRGLLWACDGKEVLFRRNREWRRVSSQDSLLDANCRALAVHPSGDLWLGYDNPAYAVIKNPASDKPKVKNITAGLNQVAANNSTNFFGVDRHGWLWRGADADYVATPDAAERGEWLRLDQQDGIPEPGGNVNAFYSESDGSVWFADQDMIAHFSPPDEFATKFPVPPVFVSAFTIGQNPPALAETVGEVPSGSNVTAHVGSLQFDRRNALRLRYRLLPEQAKWRETKSLDLPLGVLGSGEHQLQVQGRVFTGPWSQTASRSFRVLRPAWLAGPLMVSYFMSAFMLAGGGFWLYSRHRAESAQLLPDLAPWRLGALVPEVHQFTGVLLDSRFAVGRLLARGGFANVMEGYDRSRQERCALKIFRTEVKDKAWIQRSFDQEVAALKKVRHPNVVSINAYGRTPSGAPYLVMEFVEGRSLRETFEDGALGPRRAARLLRQLAGALAAIHAQAICHRDLKPENIIVRNEGKAEEEAVLIDFSIAIIKDADETLHGLSRAAGTFDYMAPEQAVGYAQPSSDIYSLARVVIEMLTGRPLRDLLPGAGLDLPDRVRALIRSLTLPLSDESIELLATALEFDPTRRPSDAASFSGPLVRDLESRGVQRTF
jgi:tRNA A-37 threonylcarbamoyl transferase component Bud32